MTVINTRSVSSRQEIYDWLNKEAEQLGIQATLITHGAALSDGRLYLRVFVGNAADAYDVASKLQELEGTWNYQEPEPYPRVFLLPADESDEPERASAYAPVQQETDRYFDAFEAFRTSESDEEMQKALKEMGDAKAAELEAAKQSDRSA